MSTTPPTEVPSSCGDGPAVRRGTFSQAIFDLGQAPGVFWGISIAYLLEATAYFGLLGGPLWRLLNGPVGLSIPQVQLTIRLLTGGTSVAMLFLGGFADRLGVRRSLRAVFILLLAARLLFGLGASVGLGPTGLWSPIHLITIAAMLLVVVAYGMFQPAVVAAVRQFTSRATAGMAFALLYAAMNMGGLFPELLMFAPMVGPVATVWFYVILTATALICTILTLARRKVRAAISDIEVARGEVEQPIFDGQGQIANDLECLGCGYNLRTLLLESHCPECGRAVRLSLAQGRETPRRAKEPFSFGRWIAYHPLANLRFVVLLFILMPVQTLYAHNWLTLPMYVDRALRGSIISDHFYAIVSLNPLLIVVLVLLFAMLTHRRRVFSLLIVGTLVMAAAPALLMLGPSPWMFVAYLLVVTIGEAIWQPRFLQYIAEIAPRGRTGVYVGVSAISWFLTKLMVPLYAAWCLQRFCPDPDTGPLHTRIMWLIYAAIAMVTPVLLVFTRKWIGKDFKTKAD